MKLCQCCFGHFEYSVFVWGIITTELLYNDNYGNISLFDHSSVIYNCCVFWSLQWEVSHEKCLRTWSEEICHILCWPKFQLKFLQYSSNLTAGYPNKEYKTMQLPIFLVIDVVYVWILLKLQKNCCFILKNSEVQVLNCKTTTLMLDVFLFSAHFRIVPKSDIALALCGKQM